MRIIVALRKIYFSTEFTKERFLPSAFALTFRHLASLRDNRRAFLRANNL